MKISIDYKFSDFYEAQKLHYFSSKIKYLFPTIGLFLMFVAGILSLEYMDILSYSSLFLGLLFLFYPFTFLFINTYLGFKKTINPHAIYEYEFNPDGIKINSKTEKGIIKWDGFIKQTNNNKVLLLYRAPLFFNVIPRRGLSEQQWKELLNLSQQELKK